MTVESKGYRGIYNENNEIIKSFAKEHDERLQNVLVDACEENHVPDGIRNEIISKGMKRFLVDKDNNLKSISVFKTIDELIEQIQKDNALIKDEVVAFADERALKKHKLKKLMVHYADLGDSKSYRNVRKEYALL